MKVVKLRTMEKNYYMADYKLFQRYSTVIRGCQQRIESRPGISIVIYSAMQMNTSTVTEYMADCDQENIVCCPSISKRQFMLMAEWLEMVEKDKELSEKVIHDVPGCTVCIVSCLFF